MAAECPNCCARYRYMDSVTDCQKLVDSGGFCIRCGERIDRVANIVDPAGLIPKDGPRRRLIDLRRSPRDSDDDRSPPWAFA